MKNKYIFSPLVVAIAGAFWISASGGVTSSQNLDRTGRPGGAANCTACHSGGSFNTQGQFSVTDAGGQPITSYVPGNTYALNISFTGSSSNIGFQSVGVLDDGSQAGTLTAVTSGTKISSLSNRMYFEHGAKINGSMVEATWVAPAAGSGDVTFYGSALESDGNGATSGDSYFNIPNLTISEDLSNSVHNLGQNSISVYPNPVVDELTIIGELANIEKIQLFNASGSLVFQTKQTVIKMSDYPAGLYFVHIQSAEGPQVIKVLKQ